MFFLLSKPCQNYQKVGKTPLAPDSPRIRNLLAHVADTVRRPDSVGSIQDAHQEHKATATPPRQVLEVRPNERRTGVSSTGLARHDRHDQGDDKPNKQESHAHARSDLGEDALTEQDERQAAPRYNNEGDEDMPTLGFVVRVVYAVHGNDSLASEEAAGGTAADPRQAVPPPSVEAD